MLMTINFRYDIHVSIYFFQVVKFKLRNINSRVFVCVLVCACVCVCVRVCVRVYVFACLFTVFVLTTIL